MGIEGALATLERTRAAHGMFDSDSACLLMVSGGSDSTALAYLAAELRESGGIGPIAMLHVNHLLRGEDAQADAAFVTQLADALGIPLFLCEIDIAAEAARTGENVEAVARRERYLAADEALASHCLHTQTPLKDGRILVAHTADDRIESFYMRSIIGAGPGGLRGMRYRNGPVCRPLLDLCRDDLRAVIEEQAQREDAVRDASGALWREDATNAHTDRFRAYVRHGIVPVARAWNERLDDVLVRTMNLIADEDDMVETMAEDVMLEDSLPLALADARASQPVRGADEEGWDEGAYADGFLLRPAFASAYRPLQRRVIVRLLKTMLGADARIEAATVEAVLDGFDGASEAPRSGYVANIQGDLAVSANKHGVRVEPMSAFRLRRKRC